MPEGHTVHRLARQLRSTLGGAQVRASSPQGRFADGATLIDGSTFLDARAWGKYLFCELGNTDGTGGGDILHVHLGLIGKFRRRPSPPPDPVGAVRLRLEGDEATWDLSGPTRCALITPDERAGIESRLGADPLRTGADTASVPERLGRTSRPIAATLLDQTIIAGIGNVYRAEILFVCGIHPATPSSALTDEQIEAIWATTVELLGIGERSGKIVTTDPAEIGIARNRMCATDRVHVYHRDRCRRCGSEIRTVELGGRPIWYCPTCQPARRSRRRSRRP